MWIGDLLRVVIILVVSIHDYFADGTVFIFDDVDAFGGSVKASSAD